MISPISHFYLVIIIKKKTHSMENLETSGKKVLAAGKFGTFIEIGKIN